MQNLRRAMPGAIFSPEIDRWVFVLPLVVAVVVSLLHEASVTLGITSDELPHWVYITGVVVADVGHVGTSLLLSHTHFSHSWGTQHWLYIITMFVVTLVMSLYSLQLVWVSLGYLTLVHYVAQQLRLVNLCKGSTAFHRSMIVLGAVCPILVWHTDAHRGFDWFFRDDPLPIVLPEVVYPIAAVVWAAAAVVFFAKGLISGTLTHTSNVTVLSSAVSWGVGILLPSPSAALLFLTIPHAIPCFVMSYYAIRNKWDRSSGGPRSETAVFIRWSVRSWYSFMAVLLVLAVFEEVLWDVLVYREWSTSVFAHHQSGDVEYAVFTSVLLLPQVYHVLADFVLWDESYVPGVNALLGAPDRTVL